MLRENIVDIQKDIVIFLMFTKLENHFKEDGLTRFSEGIYRELSAEGGACAGAMTFLQGLFNQALEMLLKSELYDFQDAQMYLVKLFSSEEITEALFSLSEGVSKDRRQASCHRAAELFHMCRLRAAYDPKRVPKSALPQP